LATRAGLDVAFVSLKIMPERMVVAICEIIVDPPQRRTGIGTAVVYEIESLARGMQCTQLVGTPEPFMRDIDRDVLVRWYSKLGFEHKADKPPSEMWKDI